MQIGKEQWLRIESGDQHAYAEVYRFLYRRFYNYGKKFTSDDSLIEDAIQETLLSIWDKRAKLSSIEYVSTYFYTSFRYVLFGKLKQQRQILLSDPDTNEPDFSIDNIIVNNETDAALKEQLQKALATLTARQREAIFLRFYEGLSYEEVAAVLNITPKATYKIMARALQQLRESLPFFSGTIIFLLSYFLAGKQPV